MSAPCERLVPGGPPRSRPVRRILRLEAEASRLLTRAERATHRAEVFLRRREACLHTIQALLARLTGTQQGELRQARGR